VVLVDTLRFSTAAITAVHRGAPIYPCALADDPEAVARRVGAVDGVGVLRHAVTDLAGADQEQPLGCWWACLRRQPGDCQCDRSHASMQGLLIVH
jgi:hypothetical protein